MKEKTELLTIFPTFENLSIVKKTLPSVIEEVLANNSKLIVHDTSVKGREEKWEYLNELNKNDDFFLILSNNMSMAHSRNMSLQLGQELFAPEYICMMEDDHGYSKNAIPDMIKAMKQYYGKKAPNGLMFGLFTGCGIHHTKNRAFLEDGNSYPKEDCDPKIIGKANSCFRVAPTSHWINVLKGYDTDEYYISTFQTRNLNFRNYNKGFTVMYIQNGDISFNIETEGRGTSSSGIKSLWDEKYTASDRRSDYLNK